MFNWRLEFDEFTRGGTGFGTQFTYPVTAWGYTSLWGFPLDEVRVGTDYRLERAEIADVGFFATRSIRVEEGTSLDQHVDPAHLAQHAEPRLRPDRRLAAGPLGRGRGARRRRNFLKAEARERWYFTFLHARSARRLHLSLRRARSATASATRA